jgi:hypothetical protein
MYRRTAHRQEKSARVEKTNFLDTIHREESFDFKTSRGRFHQHGVNAYDYPEVLTQGVPEYVAPKITKPIVHKIFKAAEDAGRALQPAVRGKTSLVKAYTNVAAKLDEKYEFPENDRPFIHAIIRTILNEHWVHAAELNAALNRKQQPRRNTADIASPVRELSV